MSGFCIHTPNPPREPMLDDRCGLCADRAEEEELILGSVPPAEISCGDEGRCWDCFVQEIEEMTNFKIKDVIELIQKRERK